MDCILLIHTHEGEPIARFIQENLRRLQVMVNVCDVTELESRNINFQLTLLLVTPEMITYMNAFGDSFRPGLHCKMNRAFGILVDKSVNMEEETIKSVLGNSLPDFKSWKIIKLTHTQPTMIQILDLLDGTQESAMPTTLKYHLQPAVITVGPLCMVSVSLILFLNLTLHTEILFFQFYRMETRFLYFLKAKRRGQMTLLYVLETKHLILFTTILILLPSRHAVG